MTGALANIPFPFGIDPSTGEYGYYKAGADAVTPFSSSAFEEVLSVTTIYGTSPSTFYAASDLSSYNTSYISWSRSSYNSLGDYFEGIMPSSGYAATIRTKVACKVMYMLRIPSTSGGGVTYYAPQSYSAYQSVVSVPNPGSWSGYDKAGACVAVLFAIKE